MTAERTGTAPHGSAEPWVATTPTPQSVPTPLAASGRPHASAPALAPGRTPSSAPAPAQGRSVRGRAANYDQQRGRILAEAARLFAQQGYVATTMNQVAQACDLSKATLYHYHRDKYSLLVSICDEHVSLLRALVQSVCAEASPQRPLLERLILRIVHAYADAQDAHRVLTEDVRHLQPDDRARVLRGEREVVDGFARALVELHPEFGPTLLDKPLTMLLFGMINWTFTWMKAGGPLTHEQLAPLVARLFIGGVAQVAQVQVAQVQQDMPHIPDSAVARAAPAAPTVNSTPTPPPHSLHGAAAPSSPSSQASPSGHRD